MINEDADIMREIIENMMMNKEDYRDEVEEVDDDEEVNEAVDDLDVYMAGKNHRRERR